MYSILGGGLAGLSASYHLGHDNCIVYEKSNYLTGHIHSEIIDGFTWDEGPHVSFTENEYVKNLFANSVESEFLEYTVKTTNYFYGTWIPHPAQTNLFAIPKEIRLKCLESYLEARQIYPLDFVPLNYKEWLDYAFGNYFTNNFISLYTYKYWTVTPDFLTTDWVGERVYFPDEKQVRDSFEKPLKEDTHYIKKVRYPHSGGYMRYADKLVNHVSACTGYDLKSIDFDKKVMVFENGIALQYDKLVSTIPLPTLIAKSNASEYVKLAATKLNCTSVLLINVTANHVTQRVENWIYVYDENKYSTRINCTELLSPLNAPIGKTGVQVEVYFSALKVKNESTEIIVQKVIRELIEMGLIISSDFVESYHSKWVEWANVIFDKDRVKNQEIVFDWLATKGLEREEDDLKPMCDWKNKLNTKQKFGDIILAGRFGQWKYFWSDDCVLRGLFLSKKIAEL